MKTTLILLSLTALGIGALGCAEGPLDAAKLVSELDSHLGKKVTVKAKLRTGIRCRLDTEDGRFMTYCRDCQVCKGPFVLDVPGVEGWPVVLAGVWEGQAIQCRGKLNQVKCHPFEPGATYVIEGLLSRSNPPKLHVDDFRLVRSPG